MIKQLMMSCLLLAATQTYGSAQSLLEAMQDTGINIQHYTSKVNHNPTKTTKVDLDGGMHLKRELQAFYHESNPIAADHIQMIDADRAWTFATGKGITVAVIDTGADETHEDLKGQVITGYDFINGRKAADFGGHGTHVAGIIAAANNSVGTVGVAYDSKVIAIKAIASPGEFSIMRDYMGLPSVLLISAAIKRAVNSGVRVINCSYAGYGISTYEKDAYDYAASKGVIVVAAAGNNSNNAPQYPAGYGSVISVAAVDSNRRLAHFSNYGDSIDVSAPGTIITSTMSDVSYMAQPNYKYLPGYYYLSGTSMAAPIITGVIALILEAAPDLTPDEVKEILIKSSEPSKDTGTGAGIINAYRAVVMAEVFEAAKIIDKNGDRKISTKERKFARKKLKSKSKDKQLILSLIETSQGEGQ